MASGPEAGHVGPDPRDLLKPCGASYQRLLCGLSICSAKGSPLIHQQQQLMWPHEGHFASVRVVAAAAVGI